MKIGITAGLFLYTSLVCANCDLTHFRWECELPIHVKPHPGFTSIVRCGDTMVYVSRKTYNQLVRNQRANIYLRLSVNENDLDGPCIAWQK